jgi:hypothetical protein
MVLKQDDFETDFAQEIRDGEVEQDTVLIQSYVRNDGVDDIYSEGRNYDCDIQYEIFNVDTPEGQKATTTAQIYLNGDVVVTARDKVTFNGVSPKLIRVSPDPLGYGIVLYT